MRKEAVELLVVANRELQVTRDDARLLVVARGVPCEFEYLGREVLEYSRDVDWKKYATVAKRKVSLYDLFLRRSPDERGISRGFEATHPGRRRRFAGHSARDGAGGEFARPGR